MPRLWVVNASPLSILGKIDQLPLLFQLASSPVVPVGVGRELEAVFDDLAARKCAAALSIPVRGTLGLLLLAKMDIGRPSEQRLPKGGMWPNQRADFS